MSSIISQSWRIMERREVRIVVTAREIRLNNLSSFTYPVGVCKVSLDYINRAILQLTAQTTMMISRLRLLGGRRACQSCTTYTTTKHIINKCSLSGWVDKLHRTLCLLFIFHHYSCAAGRVSKAVVCQLCSIKGWICLIGEWQTST